MKHKMIKIGFIALSFFAVIILINSCKKTGVNEPEQLDAKANESFFAAIKADVEKNGLVQRVEVNQKIKAVYTDLNGNEVTPPNSQNLTSTCGFSDPGIAELSYYEKKYQCNLGYYIKWYYNVSWNNNIVPTGPTGVKTRGTVRVALPGNANAYSNTTFDVEIIDFGPNPDQITYPDENIYSVSFTTSTIIPESILNASGAILRLGAVFISDCPILEQSQILLSNAFGPYGIVPLNSSPCQRVEAVFVDLPGPLNGPSGVYRRMRFAGFDPFSLCQYQYSCDPNYPDYQEVQYQVDGGTWLNAINPGIGGAFAWMTGTAFILRTTTTCWSGPITPGVHTVQVRARNWKYNSCPTPFSTVPNTTNSCDASMGYCVPN